MANVYPPSPALSACDSLADIEDLDAFLDAQGKLSKWPTPPLAKNEVEELIADGGSDISSVDLAADADDDLWRIASAFTNIATGRSDSSYFDLELVLGVLFRADVLPHTLALAYNILKAVTPSETRQRDAASFPLPDLAITACLSLATTFLHDKAPGSDYWAREVSKGFWPAHHIDMTVLDLLELPSLHMLALSSPSAINSALRELCQIANTPMDEFDICDELKHVEDAHLCSQKVPEPLTVDISEGAQWVNGALTPAETPVLETSSFLPLL